MGSWATHDGKQTLAKVREWSRSVHVCPPLFLCSCTFPFMFCSISYWLAGTKGSDAHWAPNNSCIVSLWALAINIAALWWNLILDSLSWSLQLDTSYIATRLLSIKLTFGFVGLASRHHVLALPCAGSQWLGPILGLHDRLLHARWRRQFHAGFK